MIVLGGTHAPNPDAKPQGPNISVCNTFYSSIMLLDTGNYSWKI